MLTTMRPSYPLCLYRPQNIWWRMQVTKLFSAVFSDSCYFLSHGASVPLSILSRIFILLLGCETKCQIHINPTSEIVVRTGVLKKQNFHCCQTFSDFLCVPAGAKEFFVQRVELVRSSCTAKLRKPRLCHGTFELLWDCGCQCYHGRMAENLTVITPLSWLLEGR
jgi:hypothetical protein